MREEITEAQFAIETLERYSGCEVAKFQSNLLLTNFPRYVEYFAQSRSVPVIEGSMFKVAHCPGEDISILDFKIGSPAAALVVDLCSFLPIKSSLLLGMCGGLRRRYQIGALPIRQICVFGSSMKNLRICSKLQKHKPLKWNALHYFQQAISVSLH